MLRCPRAECSLVDRDVKRAAPYPLASRGKPYKATATVDTVAGHRPTLSLFGHRPKAYVCESFNPEACTRKHIFRVRSQATKYLRGVRSTLSGQAEHLDTNTWRRWHRHCAQMPLQWRIGPKCRIAECDETEHRCPNDGASWHQGEADAAGQNP